MKRHLSKILVPWSAFLNFVNSPRKLPPPRRRVGRGGGGGGDGTNEMKGVSPRGVSFW